MLKPFPKTTNPIFNKLVWLESVPIGSSIFVYVYERIEGLDPSEATFCHGKATIKPWESQGVEGLQDLPHTYGAWVDLVAQTKVDNDRGPIIKVSVAISDTIVKGSVLLGPDLNQALSLPQPQVSCQKLTRA